jgi:hypothetical protein
MDAQSWSIIIAADSVGVDPTSFWTAIITVFFISLTNLAVKLYSMYLESKARTEVAARVEQVKMQAMTVATRVEEVKEQVAKVSAEHIQTLETVLDKVEEVRHGTNSLTDRLVTETGKSEFARGKEEQRLSDK